MANSLLFKWEDSPSLKHHCGFCERPLNHPGAKNSCLGTHAEPCTRFHQALFMRNRAHMCASCNGADEAHHKRHAEICEKLRRIFELNDEDISLLPTLDLPRGPRERGQDDVRPPDDDTRSWPTDSIPADGIPVTRKQKKDAKKLAKVASRPKVIKQEEIEHIGSIIHHSFAAAEGSDGPVNFAEIEEIEKHLRYNANVYNRGVKRHALRRFANLQDADVDFDREMDRILADLKVTDLVKRNKKNKGLQGKEFKIFETLVADLKALIVEDLVLVKRDEMETRMRRAGYLRYASRTSFEILEDRYTDKDWKTGERIVPPEPAVPETPTTERISDSTTEPNQKENAKCSAVQAPDLRHLVHGHKRLASEGKAEDVVVVRSNPRPAPLPAPIRSRPASIRVTLNPASNDVEKNRFRTPTDIVAPLRPRSTQNQVVPALAPANAWFPNPSRAQQTKAIPEVMAISNKKRPAEKLFVAPKTSPKNPKKVDRLVVQPIPSTAKTIQSSDNGPEEAPISQKKCKKKAREAKRKEKKKAAQQADEAANPEVEEDEPDEPDEPISGKNVPLDGEAKIISDSTRSHLNDPESSVFEGVEDSPMLGLEASQFPFPPTPPESVLDSCFPQAMYIDATPESPALPQVMALGKQVTWMRDSRHLTVDALTDPFLVTKCSCSHVASSRCPFESLHIRDCPFHEPCCTFDPKSKEDQCILVYPSTCTKSLGPFNRLRAKKLLAIFNTHYLMKDRLMMIDEIIFHWIIQSPTAKEVGPPLQLSTEYHNYHLGAKEGPLMRQETQYFNLFHKNKDLPKHQQLSTATLNNVHKKAEPVDGEIFCYCHGPVPPDDEFEKGVIECSFAQCEIRWFHRKCLEGQGLDLLSKWYCAACDRKMRKLAEKVLDDIKMGRVMESGEKTEDETTRFFTEATISEVGSDGDVTEDLIEEVE
ncbi:hypothetical protein K504DRAFT_463380 [Pleomassaria siparia CBS 279.74]|uniref:Zinc finger PHD-type domain-containing protein n=1 Tax=Pleomassaria siparia CBS 279.74 TaxID=1314801 RepID=A0A6G1JT14_9PLEO|nr:hypothetical protein K504DRAFT_463380 [Pleomassaria siparia CBS 279.74]